MHEQLQLNMALVHENRCFVLQLSIIIIIIIFITIIYYYSQTDEMEYRKHEVMGGCDWWLKVYRQHVMEPTIVYDNIIIIEYLWLRIIQVRKTWKIYFNGGHDRAAPETCLRGVLM